MEIEPELLGGGVCPACRARRSVAAGEGGLRCLGCRRLYPVRDGIPVLLVEEAVEPGSPERRP